MICLLRFRETLTSFKFETSRFRSNSDNDSSNEECYINPFTVTVNETKILTEERGKREVTLKKIKTYRHSHRTR